MHKSRGDNIQQILDAIGPLRAKWGSDESGAAGFLSTKRDVLSTSQRPIFTKFGNDAWIYVSPRMVSEEIFENVSFRGHLPLKTSKLEGVKQAPYGDQPLVQKTHCKKILIFILCPRAREFSNLFNFFYTTYSFGPSKFPNFPILPIFPIQYA